MYINDGGRCGSKSIKRKILSTFQKRQSCGEGTQQRKCKKNEGFTYVETLSVLAIGAILSATAVMSGARIISIAKKTSAKTQIQQFSTALQTYFLDCGRFPTTEQGIRALWEKPEFYPVPENWAGPYLERKPSVDPWGRDYQYYSSESSPLPSSVPKNLPFILISFGSDGIEGGEGDASDIVSWK